MRISKNTIDLVESVKVEVQEIEQQLENLSLCIKEHPGTKKIAAKLDRAREKLEEWRKVA